MKRHPSLMVIFVALVGLGFCAALSRGLYLEENESITADFRTDVTQLATAFEREVRLNLEILFALKTSVGLMPEMNARLFEKLTRQILERSPAIKAFAWSPVVSLEDRGSFEQRQQYWHPGFMLSEMPPTADSMPAEKPL